MKFSIFDIVVITELIESNKKRMYLVLSINERTKEFVGLPITSSPNEYIYKKIEIDKNKGSFIELKKTTLPISKVERLENRIKIGIKTSKKITTYFNNF